MYYIVVVLIKACQGINLFKGDKMYYKLLCTSREINRIIRRRCASSDTYLKGELYDIGKTDIIVKAHMVKLQVDSTITRLDILDELLDTGKHVLK